jgi:phosphoserine aminotransferase
MTKARFNFGAGPGHLPPAVLQIAQQQLLDWQECGLSVLELGHRSELFQQIIQAAERDLRDLLAIPKEYRVLFMQGGARGQFAAVPLNLLGKQRQANYIESGYWSRCAALEGERYCSAKIIDVRCRHEGLSAIKPMREWPISDQAELIHYCPNETIEGVAIDEVPGFGDRVVVADMSSTLLSRPIEINRFGVIYACAQKNIGPAGITLVIIREDLLGRAVQEVPSVLNYTLMAQSHSLYNTPPTFAWYCCGLMFKWLKAQGGLAAIALHNQQKAARLYEFIDAHSFYINQVHPAHRSLMNVPFWLLQSERVDLFLQQAQAVGLYALKGHQSVGGIRASLYNAMPCAGVDALVDFMNSFIQHDGTTKPV